jgi:hypothetical protein
MSEQAIPSSFVHPILAWRLKRMIFLSRLQCTTGIDYSIEIDSLQKEVFILERIIGQYSYSSPPL